MATMMSAFTEMTSNLIKLSAKGISSEETASKNVPENNSSEVEEVSSDDEPEVIWAGAQLVNKEQTVRLSDGGKMAWMTLTGLDGSGKANRVYKKLSRKPKDIDFYTKIGHPFI